MSKQPSSFELGIGCATIVLAVALFTVLSVATAALVVGIGVNVFRAITGL